MAAGRDESSRVDGAARGHRARPCPRTATIGGRNSFAGAVFPPFSLDVRCRCAKANGAEHGGIVWKD